MAHTIDPRWQTARRVLAVRLDTLGDVLVTTPALHAIKTSLPQATLTLLTSPVGAQVGRLNPDLDDVIMYQAPWIDPWCTLPQDSEREQAIIALLKGRQFDGAIIFTSFGQSALPAAYLCYLADISLRLAAPLDDPGSLLTTRHTHPERRMHEVERGLDLVGAIGLHTDQPDLVLRVSDPARARMRAALPQLQQPVVVLHPGCTIQTDPWEMYAEVADLLVERLGATVLLTGAQDERELITRIHEHMRPETRQAALPAAGTLSFAAFCALIEVAAVVVTGSLEPMHIAAALKTPVVTLFALTGPPEQPEPWRVPHRQLFHQEPSRTNGVAPGKWVAPSMVVDAAAELLQSENEEQGDKRAQEHGNKEQGSNEQREQPETNPSVKPDDLTQHAVNEASSHYERRSSDGS
jgi:ADP-heptose:LPS heptosyltransferase